MNYKSENYVRKINIPSTDSENNGLEILTTGRCKRQRTELRPSIRGRGTEPWPMEWPTTWGQTRSRRRRKGSDWEREKKWNDSISNTKQSVIVDMFVVSSQYLWFFKNPNGVLVIVIFSVKEISHVADSIRTLLRLHVKSLCPFTKVFM